MNGAIKLRVAAAVQAGPRGIAGKGANYNSSK